VTAVLGLLVLLGAGSLVRGAASTDPTHAWSIYLVNLLFWSGLAVTGPAIASMMELTEARWSPTVKRLALTTAGFLPVSLILFVLLFAGRGALYAWVREPVPVKAAWLNVPFMAARTAGGTFLLFWSCFTYAAAVFHEDPMGRDKPRRTRLATTLLVLFVVVVSLWGFDLVMSIDPTWYSGLFGGYFVVSALYTGFALLSLLTIRANARGEIAVSPSVVQDVAKLQFAMSIMWMYFFWSQYLVIWYGNVPVETRFFVRRLFVDPWRIVAWVVLVVGWVLPFCYLLKRLTGRPPEHHTPLVVVSLMGLGAIFLERVFLVFPAASGGSRLPLAWGDLFVTAGFLALFLLSRRWFFARFKPGLISGLPTPH
jgi:Ni/Fe-hydrogenase subunit HybB-like protein